MPCNAIRVQRLRLPLQTAPALLKHERAPAVVRAWLEEATGAQVGNPQRYADRLEIAVRYGTVRLDAAGVEVIGTPDLDVQALRAFIDKLGRAAQSEAIVAAIRARAAILSEERPVDDDGRPTGLRVIEIEV